MRIVRPILLVLAEVVLAAIVTTFILFPEVWGNLIDSILGFSFILRLLVVLLADIALLRLVSSQLHSARETVKDDDLLVRDSQALAAIQNDSVRDYILKGVEQVPNVTDADTRVKAIRNRADVELDITFQGDLIDVRRKQKEINHMLKRVVTKQLGLRLAGRPRVNIRLQSEPPGTSGTEETAKPPAPQVAAPNDKMEVADNDVSAKSGGTPTLDGQPEEQLTTT